jgi:hypothetical protein
MEKFLKEIGFTNMTGSLWKHEKFGIMQIHEGRTKQEIIEMIYQRGWHECQAIIRGSLGIVEPRI